MSKNILEEAVEVRKTANGYMVLPATAPHIVFEWSTDVFTFESFVSMANHLESVMEKG